MATLLGLAVFKRRIKGAYFAILSQALAVAFATLLVSQIKVTGGANGLNSFTSFFGYALYDPVNKRMIYFIAAGLLVAMLLVAFQLYRSRFGELLVATRDAEERVRFLGHDPANIKLAAFVIAAVMASIGGAMFVPIAGHRPPLEVERRRLDQADRRRRARRAGVAARAGRRGARGRLSPRPRSRRPSRDRGPTSRVRCSFWSSCCCPAASRRCPA